MQPIGSRQPGDPRELLVELSCEHDRGLVADLELHRDHCRDVTLDERSGHSGKGIRPRCSCPLAGVQDRETKRRDIAQDEPQLVAADRVRPAVVLLEQEDPSFCDRVIAAVADVVHAVECLRLEGLQQCTKRRPFEPLQLDCACATEARKGAVEVLSLALDVKLLVLGWTADDSEEPERRLHEQRTVRAREVQIANDRRELRHGQKSGSSNRYSHGTSISSGAPLRHSVIRTPRFSPRDLASAS